MDLNRAPLVYAGDTPPGNAVSLLGGKAANLLRLVQWGHRVPEFFVVTTVAFRAAIEPFRVDLDQWERADAALQTSVVDRLTAWLTEYAFPPSLRAEIERASRQQFDADTPLAVRSSAADEDAAEHSLAGMHDSFLFVRGSDDLIESIRKVWLSVFHERAIAYRRHVGLPMSRVAIAVVVQRMIEARTSGVMFSCNPVNQRVDQVVISSLFGAGEGLVSGGLDADTYTIDKTTRKVTDALADKPTQLAGAAEGGLQSIAVPDHERAASSLDPSQLQELLTRALAIERSFRRPQDIEFCFDQRGQLFILQSRPVTNVTEYGPAAGNRLIWDNSNIIESYCGVTTPMTFSFIRRSYTIVYHCFANVMGIHPDRVKQHRHVFENMLGLFRGRVYYNLQNWYRLIRLFPGFEYNAQFMEQMMGLKEPLILGDPQPHPSRWRRWFVELPALLRLLSRSAVNFWRIDTIVQQFEGNFAHHYRRWCQLDFGQLAPDELMRLYHEMEDELLWQWKAPIINDFYVMIYYGLLKKLCQSWAGDSTGALQNDLICGEGGVESAEPAKLLLKIAAMAQHDSDLRQLIMETPPQRVSELIEHDPRFAEFRQQIADYLDLYGFRCMNELKLEEHSLRERPEFLYQVLRNYLSLDDPAALDVEAIERREQAIRDKAEARVRTRLQGRRGIRAALQRLVFGRVLANARRGVKYRENMRFARTRIYGLARELWRSLGRQLADERLLDEPDDVFYLTVDEAWDFVKGTAVSVNLRAIANLRKQEYDRYRDEQTPVPDDRFETFGMAYHRNRYRRTGVTEQVVGSDGALQGTGCCPGEVTGIAKVLRHPTDDIELSGEILVAERTDPGWVPLYPAVSGIAIERGSILSHSAVVAREMGIPAVVGITGLLKMVATGDEIQIDGTAGTVRLVRSAVNASNRS